MAEKEYVVEESTCSAANNASEQSNPDSPQTSKKGKKRKRMTKEEWEESEEIYFRKIDQMGLINVTKQKISLRRRADILNCHCNYDCVVLYHSSNPNAPRGRHIFDCYATRGKARKFLNSEPGRLFAEAFKRYHKATDTKSSIGNGTSESASKSSTSAGTSESASKSSNSTGTSASASKSSTSTGTSVELVMYTVNGKAIAGGLLEKTRQILHGTKVLQDHAVVRVTWVAGHGVAAPLVLGEPDENSILSTGQFFAFPRKALAVVKWANN